METPPVLFYHGKFNFLALFGRAVVDEALQEKDSPALGLFQLALFVIPQEYHRVCYNCSRMKAYLQIIKGTWAEYMEYRLSFVLWRVRMVMQLLVTYFLWWALFAQRHELFGYTQAMIFTYIFLSLIVRPLVMGTRTQEIGSIINTGELSNYLIRPVHILRYFFSRDMADKAMNIFFAVFEIGTLYALLRPPLFIQTNPTVLLWTLAALGVGVGLFFYFSLMLSYVGFWSSDTWAPRFLSFALVEFFGGALFPLDILPQPLFILAQNLPFSYFLYFPIKMYLGQLGPQAIIGGFFVGIMWLVIFYVVADSVWRKGLRVYGAEGR